MILCASPNLCRDRILVVRDFETGRVHRAEQVVVRAGGKGLNVARVVRALGGSLTLVGFVGGSAGRAIVREATACGLLLDPVRMPGESRTCTLVVDPDGSETVINEAGAPVGDDQVRALRRRVGRHLKRSHVVVLTGSLLPGMPPDFYAAVIQEAAPRPTILDTSGEALRRGAEAGPTGVKCNRRELEGILGRALPTVADVAEASRALLAWGTGWIAVTLGAQGATLVTRDGSWLLRPPRVQRANAIGAGDGFTAGMAVGFTRGLSLVDAARLGTAAAAADVATLLPGTVERTTVEALVPKVGVESVEAGV
ncbi:MAG: hexose kinase [Armatimonadota bacterium]|nr:hexose kinase [Armatimonadota bacterium]MDR7550417.1 hexose kinase [Armatimonadota bacterium]